jgi:hypothetical protein
MADPTPLNRNQIARFVGNDPDAIRAIERLFVVAGQLTPSDIATLTQLIVDVGYSAGVADNKAEVALSEAFDAKRLADLLAMAPAPQDPRLDRLLDVQAPFAAAGMVIIYDATKRRWLANTITAGANITVTNADGAITVAVSGLGTMAFENIGASGSFTAASGETITVVDGIITSIV